MDECGNQHHTCNDTCTERCNHCGAYTCNLGDAFTRWRAVKGEDPLCPKCQLKFPTVLVVDDDPCMVDALEMLLETEGFTVATATTMAEASEHLGRRAFQVVLLDMQGGDIDRPRVGEVARAKGAAIVTMSADVRVWPDLLKPFGNNVVLEKLRAAASSYNS